MKTIKHLPIFDIMLPGKLQKKLDERKENQSFRKLNTPNALIDFSSNDYLGFSKLDSIFNATHQYLIEHKLTQNGATGSRLLTGNHNLYTLVEQQISDFHNAESALVFNSGYTANLGFFACVPQRGDIILFDEYIHASIRDGIQLSNAKAYKFEHNNLEHLQKTMLRFPPENNSNIYIVTESVFSMDGDSPYLLALSQIANKNKALLVVDEAHAIGVFGENGSGLIPQLKLENNVFARIITFGKALGCHGAAILGSQELKHYLINFSRPFIYTTALPPHSLATIHCTYKQLEIKTDSKFEIEKLEENISFFKSEIKRLQLENNFIKSNSAIHCCIIPGNEKVKISAEKLQKNNFSVKPILSPTVKKGQERLRFCLHSYNSKAEITKVLQLLATFVTV